MPNGTDKGKQTNKKLTVKHLTLSLLTWNEKKKRKFEFHQELRYTLKSHWINVKISSGRISGWKGAHSEHLWWRRTNITHWKERIWGTFQSQIHPDFQVYSLYFCYWMLSMILFSYLPAHTFTHTEPAVTWNRFAKVSWVTDV